MIGELASALPHEGGYYAWARRALGNFWGFQEAWLSLAASIFDMAIYPDALCRLSRATVPLARGRASRRMVALAMVVTCAALNIAGIRVVGITSLWLFFLLSAPFAVMVALAPFRAGALDTRAHRPGHLDGGTPRRHR